MKSRVVFQSALLALAMSALFLLQQAKAQNSDFFVSAGHADMALLATVLKRQELDGASYSAQLLINKLLLANQYAVAQLGVAHGHKHDPNEEAGVHKTHADEAQGNKPTLITVAWEELSPSRAVRFNEGDRVLLCLQALPSHSIWKRRIPNPLQRANTWAVANKGNCFIRSPSISESHVLEHYYALSASLRRDISGHAYLIELIANAQIPLAKAAISVLASREDLAQRISAKSKQLLLQSLLRPELTSLLVELIVHSSIRPVLPQLEQWHWPKQQSLIYYSLKTQLNEALSMAEAQFLLQANDAKLRLLAAKYLDDSHVLREQLALEKEADWIVAATARISLLEGEKAIPLLLDQLQSGELEVRNSAAQILAKFGTKVRQKISKSIMSNSGDSAFSGILALSLMGSDGKAMLREIAHEHRHENVRILAKISLGEDVGHDH